MDSSLSDRTPSTSPSGTDPSSTPSIEDRIHSLAEEYLELLRMGEAVDRADLLASHPDIADDLERRLDFVEMMHVAQAGPPSPEDEALGSEPDAAPGQPYPEDTLDVGEGDARSGRIGPYFLRDTLGMGGMGVVYLAEQTEPVRRKVALKLIQRGMVTDDVIARFESERQALALMDHPNIAKVYEAGATEAGRPYFVMEYVPGSSLTKYCDRVRLGTRERLQLFAEVCDAVQHAHQKGIIHRDIKPSNLLVTETDGQPRPKVIDFGVAKAVGQKLTDKTLFTSLGQVIGTLEYMSPEQAEGGPEGIDSTTDIYSLGVTLYELLTGTLPFDSETLRAGGLPGFRRLLREKEPPRPSTKISSMGEDSTTLAEARRTKPAALTRLLRGDLDWVIMKALEKDRARRYASASELAADIRRHLADEPVVARPPSALYRLGKVVRKHKVGVTAAAAVAASLVAGLVVSMALYVRAEDEAEKALMVSAFLKERIFERDPWHEATLFDDPDNEDDLAKANDELRLMEEQVRVDFAKHADVQADLWLAIAKSYNGRGMRERTHRLIEDVYEIRRSLFDDDDPRLLEARAARAGVLVMRGRGSEAEAELRDVLDVYGRVHGTNDVEYVRIKNKLGMIVGQATGHKVDWRDAIRIQEEVLAVAERIPEIGPDDFELCWTRLLLGVWYRDYPVPGGLERAEALFDEVYSIYLGKLGPKHKLTQLARTNIAMLHRKRGQRSLWKGKELREEADLLEDIGRSDQAQEARIRSEELLVEAGLEFDASEKIYREYVVEPTGELIKLALVLADLRRERGDDETKIQAALAPWDRRTATWLRELEERQGQAWGAGVNEAAQNRGRVLEKLGREEEALEIYRRYLRQSREGGFGPMYDKGRWTYLTARLLGDLGRLEEAEEITRRTIDACKTELGPRHSRTLDQWRFLGKILDRAERPLDAIQILEARLDETADLAGSFEDSEEALSVRAAGAEPSEKGRDDWMDRKKARSRLQLQLGGILVHRERFEEAEAVLLRALDEIDPFRAESEAEHASLQEEVAEALIRLYIAWGRPERAVPYLEPLLAD